MYGRMELELLREVREKRHFHPEIEVLFVVEGEAQVTLKDLSCQMEKEDVFLINSGVMHYVESAEGALICMVRFPYMLAAEMTGNGNSIFICNSVADMQHSYEEIREIFHELVYQYIRQSHKTECLLTSLLFRLLDCLIEQYGISDNFAEMQENEDDMRLQQIFRYVNENYQTGISLSELADSLFLSTSTLSRFFRKQTGIYFSDYVNQLKCRYAVHDLLYTEKSMTKLAMDCGFSSQPLFNKVFRELYGMTPSDYRKNKQQDVKERREKKDALLKELREELKERKTAFSPVFRPWGQDAVVHGDVSRSVSYEKNWNRVINIGSMYSLTLANVQYHTLYLAKHLGFQYVRLWSIFSKRLMLTDGEHIGNYHYDILDGVLDFLVQNHLHPFLDFGKRPDTVIESENKPVFYGGEYVEFQSREAWLAMFQDFVRHVLKRYGKEEVGKWIFEVSHDVNHISENQYYRDENYDALEVYQDVYAFLKEECPEAKVGAPGIIFNSKTAHLERFFSGCVKKGILPDFVSFILFPYENHDEGGVMKYYRVTRENFEIEQVRMIKEVMERTGLGGCKLYVTEWNNTVSNRNYLNDSCFRAAYAARKIEEIWDEVDLICPWTGSDWVSSYYDTRGLANGGNGFLTKDTVRKPVFFAFQFLNDLGDKLIAKNEHCIITQKGQNYYIVCFNFKSYGCNYFLDEESMDSPDHLKELFENKDPLDLEIVLENMPESVTYIITCRTINEENGSFLDEWKKFQYDHQMTGADVKYVRESCFPCMSRERREVKNGTLSIKKTLLPHEISLFHIYED